MDRILNLATYYVLPMVELSKNSFGDAEDVITTDSNFINCYLTDQNHIAVKVEDANRLPSNIFDNPYYFTDYEVDGKLMILFRATGAYLEDLQKFRDGKYSRMSQLAKDRISMFGNLHENSILMKILRRDKELRKKLEEELGVILDDESEVKSAPRDSNFITLTQTEETNG